MMLTYICVCVCVCRALKRGCRCVEVDCWEGSDGEPIVYHGHTLTSKILFRDVISTLKEYAFKVSAGVSLFKVWTQNNFSQTFVTFVLRQASL